MLDVAVTRVTKRMLLVMMIRLSFGIQLMTHFSNYFRQEINDPERVLMRVNQQSILVDIIFCL